MADFAEEEFERVAVDDEELGDVEMTDVHHAANDDRSFNLQPHANVAQHDVDVLNLPHIPHTHFQSNGQRSPEVESKKFVIAVDFGTTFSTVAFACFNTGTDARLIKSDSIRCIDNYPDMPPGGPAIVLANNPTAPTELLCTILKTQPATEEADASDHESVCSLDEVWAPSVSNDSDHDQGPIIENRKIPMKSSAWGWGVHSKRIQPENLPRDLKHMKNFKLQLDVSSDTEKLRKESIQEMRKLKGLKTVDIISEYLYQLLRHTKARLTTFYGLDDNSLVEFVLSVPTSWTDKSCRIMTEALTTAVRESELVKLERNDVVRDLFVVAESEAAAGYALADDVSALETTNDESFLVLDCGGGTVDAITYTKIQSYPTRLREVVSPDARTCGSSFLNLGFEELLKRRLKHARIEGNEIPLDTVIATKVQEFENIKKTINILDKKAVFEPVFIHGLQEDSNNGCRRNRLDITWKEMYKIFKPCISGVADLMTDQLNEAKRRSVNIQTVILIGGFGESPSLKNHLERVLRTERNLQNQSIDLMRPNYVESAVARGAVLRALRKENGPERFLRSSYGILRTVPYDYTNSKHRKFRVERSSVDGELYVVQTIEWVLEKVRTIISWMSKSICFWRLTERVRDN